MKHAILALLAIGILVSGTLLLGGCGRLQAKEARVILYDYMSGQTEVPFSNSKVMKTEAGYIKFMAGDGRIIEFSGRYLVLR